MKIKYLLFSLLLSASLPTFSQDNKLNNIANDPNTADFKFEKEEYNFGKIMQGESVTYDFKFINTGSEPLIISKAEGSCGCTVPIWPKEPIMKGQTASVKVTFNSAGKLGVQDKTVTLTSNAATNPMIIHIKGSVEKPILPSENKTK